MSYVFSTLPGAADGRRRPLLSLSPVFNIPEILRFVAGALLSALLIAYWSGEWDSAVRLQINLRVRMLRVYKNMGEGKRMPPECQTGARGWSTLQIMFV